MEILSLITILGPTATGKTRFAALLAKKINAEIISADSRQVYRGMDIGTGKDLNDYIIDGEQINYHIIDVAHPNEEYSVFRFKTDFLQVVRKIIVQGKIPILCGGTGLYLDAILKDYFFVEVPENPELREELNKLPVENLSEMLKSMKKVHNKTDLEDKNRLIRAIEIQKYYETIDTTKNQIIIKQSVIFGMHFPREIIRNRIEQRLKNRIDSGMIEEIKKLMADGVSAERLKSFGLEYKFVTLYVEGHLSKEEMQQKLTTAIQRFSKRQMTWFRRMEKQGIKINWINGELSDEEKVNYALKIINTFSFEERK